MKIIDRFFLCAAAILMASSVVVCQKATMEYSQATPSEAYKMAWDLRDKKDVADVKRVLSKELLDFLADGAKEDKKTLDDEIKGIFDSPQAKTAESRNEKITGDTANLEYLDEKGEWKPMYFIKEDGVWKMALAPADKPQKRSTRIPARQKRTSIHYS